MTIDEAIQRENNIAEENQKIVDTGIVFDDVSLSQLYCDDTEVIEEHLEYYKKCVEYHKQIAEWLEELKELRKYFNSTEIGTYRFQKGYNKGIDALCNELKNHYTEYNTDCVLENTVFYSYTTACNYLEYYIDYIAKQLKAGDIMDAIKTVKVTNPRNVLVQIPACIVAQWNPQELTHLEVLYDKETRQVCIRPCVHG